MQQVKHWLLPVRNYNNGFFIHTKLLVLPGVFFIQGHKKKAVLSNCFFYYFNFSVIPDILS